MSAEANKRIAKNTIYLYLRTGITMLVALYTSRIVLDALGIEDFGIWSVLGGVITIFGFINQSLSASIFRYITHAIGTGDKEQINRTYSCSITIHAALAVIIFLLCETAGQWLLADKLVIPEEKRDIAETVFHIAAATGSISLLTVPFSSVIIAREQMHVFAYLSIAETLLKLAIAAAVYMAPARKLIWYAAMMLAATLLILLFLGEGPRAPRCGWAVPALLAGGILLASLPYCTDFLYVGHDLRFHCFRIWALGQSLAEGQFPVRMLSAGFNGYGDAASLERCVFSGNAAFISA